jgi:hypothetical protein
MNQAGGPKVASRSTFSRMLVSADLWKFLWIAGIAEEETSVLRWDSANRSNWKS